MLMAGQNNYPTRYGMNLDRLRDMQRERRVAQDTFEGRRQFESQRQQEHSGSDGKKGVA